MPRIRTEWTRMPAGPEPPRAPGRTSVRVGSGAQVERRRRRSVAAVTSAVPDGASALLSWCSSMISAVSKNGAASSRRRISSTAEIEKLAATRTFPPPAADAAWNADRSSSVSPVVPTTAWIPAASDIRDRRARRPATVKSTTTSQPAPANAVTSPAIVDAFDRLAGRAGIDASGELELGVGGDRSANRPAHATPGAVDTDPDHAVPSSSECGVPPVGAPRTRARPALGSSRDVPEVVDRVVDEVAGERVDGELRPVAARARAVELVQGDRFERGTDRFRRR